MSKFTQKRKRGNNGNHGKKGRSGRKSAYQEKADAARLFDLVTRKYTAAELKKIAKDRNLPLDFVERYVIQANLGRSRAGSDVFNKIFPDTLILSEQDIPFEMD